MLEEFLPGLRRLAALFPCHSCRMKRQLFLEELREQATNVGTTVDALFVQGQELLEKEELADIEALKYLAPVAGNADDPACDSFHEGTNRSILSKVFRDTEP